MQLKNCLFFFLIAYTEKERRYKEKEGKTNFCFSVLFSYITPKLHFKILAIQNIRFLKNFVFEVTSLLQQMERYEKAD